MTEQQTAQAAFRARGAGPAPPAESVLEPGLEPGRGSTSTETSGGRGVFLYTVDAAVGTALAMLMYRSALTPDYLRAVVLPTYVGVTAAVLSGLAVGLRRLAPLPMLALAFVASVASYLGGFQRDPFIAVGLALYMVAAVRPKRVSLGALLGLIFAMVLTFGGAPIRAPIGPAQQERWIFLAQSVAPAAVLCAAWAVGFAVRRQRGYLEAVRAQAQNQVRAQHELAWRTVTEERLRIARELHDVVAHSLSVITVQAGVGRHVLDAQPQQAGSALAVIETTGREALQELRQLLGVLREDGGDAARAPAPRIADLDDVVRRVRQAGTAVDLDIRGTRRALPAGVEVAAYRIVQEALTNVVKHARTDHCRVRLVYAPDALNIEVTDDGVGVSARRAGQGAGDQNAVTGSGTPAGHGHGIIGMRERAALHGGVFEAGPLPVRGFRVAAGLPVNHGAALEPDGPPEPGRAPEEQALLSKGGRA